jgi:ABC-type lipoprotein export system ATPase subunit
MAAPTSPAAAPKSAESIVAVQNLHKTYRLGRVDVPVLRGVSLSVRRGEWLAIRGASGSGKSTLLHLIGGLDRPDRKNGGSISFQGKPLSEMSQGQLDRFRATNVGFVFQFYHLLPELTVLQNVTIASLVRDNMGHSKKESTARATELLSAFGLGQRLRHRPTELSGGERQRVAIARALINQPDVLLADEPTGNLDRATGDKILEALQSVRASRNQTSAALR